MSRALEGRKGEMLRHFSSFLFQRRRSPPPVPWPSPRLFHTSALMATFRFIGRLTTTTAQRVVRILILFPFRFPPRQRSPREVHLPTVSKVGSARSHVRRLHFRYLTVRVIVVSRQGSVTDRELPCTHTMQTARHRRSRLCARVSMRAGTSFRAPDGRASETGPTSRKLHH